MTAWNSCQVIAGAGLTLLPSATPAGGEVGCGTGHISLSSRGCLVQGWRVLFPVKVFRDLFGREEAPRWGWGWGTPPRAPEWALKTAASSAHPQLLRRSPGLEPGLLGFLFSPDADGLDSRALAQLRRASRLSQDRLGSGNGPGLESPTRRCFLSWPEVSAL